MSHVISTHLQDPLFNALETIAETRHRKFSEIVQEALHFYVREYADYKIALDRLENHTDEVIDEAELKNRLGWT